MLNTAHDNKQLLDCIERLEHRGTVEIELTGQAANDLIRSPSDMRQIIIRAADKKLMDLIYLATANVFDENNPKVSVTRTVSSCGEITITRQIKGDKIAALGKLLKLVGGYREGLKKPGPCY